MSLDLKGGWEIQNWAGWGRALQVEGTAWVKAMRGDSWRGRREAGNEEFALGGPEG